MPFRLLIGGVNWPPETFLLRLIDGLLEAGVDVTVGSAGRPAGREGRVQWLRTPSWDDNFPLKLARLFGLAAKAWIKAPGDLKLFTPRARGNGGLAQRLRAWNRLLPYAGGRWDAIYFPWNSVSISLLPVFDLPSPVVVSCRGTQVSVGPHNPERTELKEGLKATFAKAAAVHCVSAATLRDACILGLDPEKARIIRPAVDTARFNPAPSRRSPDGVLSVVTVGTLIWVKGHEWALQAMRRVIDRGINARFEIIGDGPDRQRLLYTIADLDLTNHVRWLGKLDAEQVLARLRQADVFLLSSLSEGISNAALEGMACGLPVVTTDCGGMREAVAEGVEGFVVPWRDAGALSDALAILATDAGLRHRMGDAARIRVEREFDARLQIGQWLELFHSVLRRSKGPAAAGASLDPIVLKTNSWPRST